MDLRQQFEPGAFSVKVVIDAVLFRVETQEREEADLGLVSHIHIYGAGTSWDSRWIVILVWKGSP